MTDQEIEIEEKALSEITVSDFVKGFVGCMYEFAPRYLPRKADTIIWKFSQALLNRPDTVHVGNDEFFGIVKTNCKTVYGLEKFLKGILMAIPEFQELNLSENEYEKGVKVDDEDRAKFAFVDRYSTIPWRNDFIDLDALIGNASAAIKRLAIANYKIIHDIE